MRMSAAPTRMRFLPPVASAVPQSRLATATGRVAREPACCSPSVRPASTLPWRSVSPAVGTRRIRVEEWRPDDPYPRALVDDWPDEASDVDAGELDLLLTDVGRILSAARRLAPEHHLPDPAFRRDDPSSTLWQAIGFAGLGPLDNQKLLREAGSPERLGLARHLIAERADVLEALLG